MNNKNSLDNQDVFHIMRNCRPMRRLKSDPVDQAVIEEILDAGTWAPNSLNSQPYQFIVVRSPDIKAFFGARYDEAMTTRFAALKPADDDNSAFARNVRTAMAFGKTLKDVPVLLVIVGERDWPFAIPTEERVGTPPPSYGSVYPAVQNILLACRAKGLGASLTTMHQVFEEEFAERLALPASHGVVAVVPIGYPKGNFGPVSRRPSRELTYHDRWGQSDLENT